MVKPRKLIRDGRRRYKGPGAVVSLLYGVDTWNWKGMETKKRDSGTGRLGELQCSSFWLKDHTHTTESLNLGALGFVLLKLQKSFSSFGSPASVLMLCPFQLECLGPYPLPFSISFLLLWLPIRQMWCSLVVKPLWEHECPVDLDLFLHSMLNGL